MLSYIVRITEDYKIEHGYSPNTLVLSKDHVSQLKIEFADANLENILTHIGVDILLVQEVGHPQVAWYEQRQDLRAPGLA